jgi:hypothetical protein
VKSSNRRSALRNAKLKARRYKQQEQPRKVKLVPWAPGDLVSHAVHGMGVVSTEPRSGYSRWPEVEVLFGAGVFVISGAQLRRVDSA